MNKDEYNRRMAEIEARYKNEKNALMLECAKSNNPYRIGDILKSDTGTIIQVERMTVNPPYSDGLPSCTYHGTALTAKLKPRKVSPKKLTIHQSRVEAKLNAD